MQHCTYYVRRRGECKLECALCLCEKNSELPAVRCLQSHPSTLLPADIWDLIRTVSSSDSFFFVICKSLFIFIIRLWSTSSPSAFISMVFYILLLVFPPFILLCVLLFLICGKFQFFLLMPFMGSTPIMHLCLTIFQVVFHSSSSWLSTFYSPAISSLSLVTQDNTVVSPTVELEITLFFPPRHVLCN